MTTLVIPVQVSLVLPPQRHSRALGHSLLSAPSDTQRVLLQAIQDLKSSPVVEPRFISMDNLEILARLEEALELEDEFNPVEVLGLSKSAFCRLAALRSNVRNNTG